MLRKKICILPKIYDCGGNPNKQWFIYYSYRNPQDNKMTRFRVYDGFTECKTKKAKYAHAEKLIQDYTYKLQNGWNPFDSDPGVIYEDSLQYVNAAKIFKSIRTKNKTFNYYSNLFLPQIQGMADKTYKGYQSKYRIFDTWLAKKGLAQNDISTITPDVMRQFFLFLINDRRYSRITVMKYRHMLERLFTWCIKNNYLKYSPMQNLPETTRENDHAPRPINENDINLLISEIQKIDKQLWLAVQLEYYCFLRPGKEIRLAKIEWFDLARGIISVPKQIIKTKRDKTVIIPNQFREYLIEHWKLHLYPGDYFLMGKDGLPGRQVISSNSLRNRFNAIRNNINLPTTYKLYSFKHTGNIRAADAGIPAYHRQMQNGHASMQSLEKYLKNKIGFKSEELLNNFPTL